MSATPLLLLHAFPLDARMWRGTCACFEAERLVLAPNLRGLGTADRGLAPLSLRQHAQDLVELLDREAVPRAFVVGLSLGGFVAMALAKLAPQRLAGWLLASTTPWPDDAVTRAERERMAEELRGMGVATLPALWIDRLLARASSDELRQELRTFMLEQDPAGVLAALRALRDRPDLSDVLRATTVPTTFVCGAHDALTPPAVMQRAAALVPGSRLHVVCDAGHLVPLEAPERFAALLRDALAEVDSG